MTVVLPSLDFSLVTNNDDMIQINVFKKIDGKPGSVQSGKWEMFAPGTRNAVITKSGSDIIITSITVDGVIYSAGAVKFMIDHTDTEDLDCGQYKHELTIVTTDGRIHTVTEGDLKLSPGIVTIRDILTEI